jgi:lipoprotein-releasing system ATP-binding protein
MQTIDQSTDSTFNMETVLKTHKITKYFYEPEKFQVLKEIDLTVSKGEFLSLVGKSGCGKSTLMYILSTMDTDYKGELEIAGTRLTDKNQNDLAAFRNRHIGFVFQFHYLLPEFTVLQNIMIPALKLGRFSREEVEDRAYSKLEMLGMKEHALKPSSKLSGGQQQRVAIARALINDPDIIMGDEPTGNLDSYNTGVVFEIFKELTSKYRQTIIAVTHDDEFAANSDRVVEMSDGRILGDKALKRHQEI